MGGRGSSGAAKNGGVFGNAKPITVETRYIEGRGWTKGRYEDTVLEAHSNGAGEVVLSYAQADSYNKTAKTNKTNYVTYTLKQGFVNDQPHNLNIDKIKSFSGQTYNIKNYLKNLGFKWRDGKWVKE